MLLKKICDHLCFNKMNKLLEIKNLSIQFQHRHGNLRIVEHVDLDIDQNEILALVGESGSGKSVTALSITGLLPERLEIISGKIIYRNQDLLTLSPHALESIRGKEIAYIFQEATASLNPVLTIGRQIQEGIMLHQNRNEAFNLARQGHSRSEEVSSTGQKAVVWPPMAKATTDTSAVLKASRDQAIDLLKLVKLPHPEYVLRSYPHQLSGGMNQRAMIAMALSSNPRLLIADEPTTALDVTIEAEIIRMLLELKEKLGFSILFITHNLALVEKFAHRVAVMFRGRIVEEADAKKIFSSPGHPHTQDLIDSIIRL